MGEERAFRVGDQVDIQLVGVRLGEINSGGFEVALYDLDGILRTSFWLPLVDSVTFTARVPAEWAPRPGDLWTDGTGKAWFFRQRHGDALGRTDGTSEFEIVESVNDLLADGPWHLVHRVPSSFDEEPPF